MYYPLGLLAMFSSIIKSLHSTRHRGTCLYHTSSPKMEAVGFKVWGHPWATQ